MADNGWSHSVESLIEDARAKAEELSGDKDGLAALIADIHEIKSAIAELWEYCSAMLVALMGDDPEVATGNSVIEKKVGAPRKAWRHDEISREVADRIVASSIDMDTGERMKTTEEMMLEMLSYGAVSYWRVKNLSKIGIVADEYCDVGEPKTSLVVRNIGTAFSDKDNEQVEE